MKKKAKYILWGVIALAVIAGVVYSLLAPTVMQLTEIRAKTAELSFTEQGTVVADNVMQVYPLVQGQIKQIPVQEGQRVRTGDVLCVIDDEPLRMQLSQAESTMTGYEAQLRGAQQQTRSGNKTVSEKLYLQNILIAQNKTDLDRAKTDLNRLELLYASDVIAKVDLEHAQEAVASLESAVQSGEHELAAIAAGTDQGSLADYYQALIQLEQTNITQIEKDIAYCSVRAPADGVITSLNVKNVNYITNMTPVAEITVADSNKIEVFVSTNDVDNIAEGDTVGLTLKRRDGDVNFKGMIADIESTAQVKLSSLGMEERKIKVTVTPNLNEVGGASLGVGYTVDVQFLLYKEDNRFTAPKTAFFKDGDRDMLWVVRNGKANAIEVVKGMELRTEFVVTSGLGEGDFVVTDANNADLSEGKSVVGEQ